MLTEAGYDMPDLPEGFAESYTQETAKPDDPAKFHKKEQYLAWMAQQPQDGAGVQSVGGGNDEDVAGEEKGDYTQTDPETSGVVDNSLPHACR